MSEETITLYEAIGGDATIRALTDRFYSLMDTLPEAARCRAIHPPDLSGSREKLYEYLTGYLGGPPRYTDKRGHPMDETITSEKLREIIWAPVERLAHHMQNQP